MGTFSLRASGAVFDDDPRFAMPSEAALRAIGIKDVEALVRDQIDRGPLEITIVGDISTEAAITEVAATFGALPRRSAPKLPQKAPSIAFPTANLHRVYTHEGRADQNVSMIAWPTADYYSDPKRAIGLQLLAVILSSREIDEVRERQGATYSANAGSSSSTEYPGFGYIETQALVKPEADDAYYRAVSEIARDLARKPVSRDEFMRARQPIIDRLANQINTNGYWLAMLSGSSRDERQIASVLARQRYIQSITPADIQNLARKYLVMGRSLRVQVKPKAIDIPVTPKPKS